MNRMTSVALTAVFLGLVAQARGAQPGSDYKHLKPIEWMIGDWVGEYTASFDLGAVKKGDRVTISASQRWILNRNYMVQDFSLEVNGKKTPDTHELAGWNEARGKLVHWIYCPFGAGEGEWTEVGDKAVLRWFVQLNDAKLEGTSILEKQDADSYTWQAKQVTLGGQQRPDWPTVTFRRKTGVPAGDLWKSYSVAAAGTWIGEGTLSRDFPSLGLKKGGRVRGQFVFKPDNNGKALVGETTFEVVDSPLRTTCRALCGWDPDAAQVRFLAFMDNGLFEEITLSEQQGTAFLGSYVARFPGTPIQRARIRMEFPDADSYTITFLDGPNKGEVLSSWRRKK